MGGDGGVVATNRRYMRGAGTADHTGDMQRKAAAKFNAQEAMTTCTLTKAPLFTNAQNGTTTPSGTIVADPYGALYSKEAAVQALLKRKQQQQSSSSEGMLGPQVRRLADLYDVRFHRDNNTSQCPITGKALTGSIPAILLVPGKEATPNVVSESALKQLSTQELVEEYGPIEKKVQLAPPPTVLEEIKKQVQAEQEKEEAERKAKKADKKKKKRKREGDSEEGKPRDKSNKDKKDTSVSQSTKQSKSGRSSKPALGDAVHAKVNSAIQENSVLSSLFNTNKKAVSEKEKKDNLFAR